MRNSFSYIRDLFKGLQIVADRDSAVEAYNDKNEQYDDAAFIAELRATAQTAMKDYTTKRQQILDAVCPDVVRGIYPMLVKKSKLGYTSTIIDWEDIRKLLPDSCDLAYYVILQELKKQFEAKGFQASYNQEFKYLWVSWAA